MMKILGVTGTIVDWLERQLDVSVGLFNLGLTALARHFEEKFVLLPIDNPFTILKKVDATSTMPELPPVKTPIIAVTPVVGSHELIATVEV